MPQQTMMGQEDSHLSKIYLYPGELHVTQEPSVIWTLLGSCLAIVLYAPRPGLTGICHAQLAEARDREYTCSDFCPDPCYTRVPESNQFKYVTCSFRYLYQQFKEFDVADDEIIVKLFGGSTMFHIQPAVKSIGEENIDVAQKMIAYHALQLHSGNIGGKRGRTLYLFSDTGEVFLKKHRPRFDISVNASFPR